MLGTCVIRNDRPAPGQANTLGALVAVVVGPVVGSAVDAFGPRPVLRLGCALSVARSAVWLVSRSPPVSLFVAEIVALAVGRRFI